MILWLSDPTNHTFEAGWAPQPRDILGGRKVGIVIPIWIFGGMAKLRLQRAARIQASVRASTLAARVHTRSSPSTQPGHRLEAFAPKKHPVFSLFYNIKKTRTLKFGTTIQPHFLAGLVLRATGSFRGAPAGLLARIFLLVSFFGGKVQAFWPSRWRAF